MQAGKELFSSLQYSDLINTFSYSQGTTCSFMGWIADDTLKEKNKVHCKVGIVRISVPSTTQFDTAPNTPNIGLSYRIIAYRKLK